MTDLTDLLEAIGGRIRELRGNTTQAVFASGLGVDRKTVMRWESGTGVPDGTSLLALFRVYGVDPRWVLVGDGQPPALPGDERELLVLYRDASLAAKAAAIGALTAKPGLGTKAASRVKTGGRIRAGGSISAGGSIHMEDISAGGKVKAGGQIGHRKSPKR